MHEYDFACSITMSIRDCSDLIYLLDHFVFTNIVFQLLLTAKSSHIEVTVHYALYLINSWFSTCLHYLFVYLHVQLVAYSLRSSTILLQSSFHPHSSSFTLTTLRCLRTCCFPIRVLLHGLETMSELWPLPDHV